MDESSEAKKKSMLTDLEGLKEEAARLAPRRPPSSLPARVQGFPKKLMGTRVISRRPKAPPRNKPCSCGSGRKYKKCCGAPERVRPKVQAVRTIPGQVIRSPQDRGVASDGLPMIATPRDLDPMGDKDIVTAEDIEREHEALVKRTMKESEDEPEGKIVIASK